MNQNIFSVGSEKQDVEVLLNNVTEALHRWEAGEASPLDLSIMLGDTGKVSQQTSRLKGRWNIDSNAIIVSTRPGLGRWIIRFQNLVRRLTWWYLEPILQQIRTFQRNSALAANGLAQNQEQILARYEKITAEYAALKKRLEVLESRVPRAEENSNQDAAS